MSQNLYKHELLALDQHAIVSATDAAGRIIHANDRFCEISGYSREELIGNKHNIVKSGLHPPAMYKELWRTISSGEVWHGELCNRRKDGSLYWVESTITPISDDQGVARQFISIRTDITHLKITEAALRRQGELQYLLTEATALLLNTTPDRTDAAITQVLRCSAEFVHADHAHLFLYSDDHQRMSNTHEWCAPGIRPGRSKMQDLAAAAVPWWTHRISRRGFIIVPDVADLPPQAGSEQVLFESLHIRSLFAHPLQQDGVTIGFIGFGAMRDARDWRLEEIHPFTVLADALASTIIRHRVERALIEREQQLRQAQAIGHMGSWEADVVTGKVIWSDETFRILGHIPGSFEPNLQAFRAATHPDHTAKVAAAEKLALRSGHFDSVNSILHPDGTVRHVHVRARVEKSDLGDPIRYAGTIHDITERVEAETRLRESEQRFSFAVEGAGDGIWDWNPQTQELSVSDHYGTMLGYDRGELTANPPRLLSSIHPEDLPLVERAIEDYLAGKSASYVMEIRMRCKNGSYKWVLIRATAVAWNQDGKVTRIIGINSDISNHKAVEQSLILAREEADRANRAKSEFLSSMSHELRTPMNAILGFGQLLETDDTLDAEQQDNVHEILKAGHHLLELINEVLDLAKVESGRIDLSLEALEVLPIAEECLNLVSPLADSHRIHIAHRVPGDILVRADRTRLKQALINLLSNAIKYNRPGGEVLLHAHSADNDRLRLLVSDTGPGIPAERMHELFQPFNRLGAEHGQIEGTGIGLTITERIVEIMGGRVGVDSRAGAGSTFWIELPREDPQQPRAELGGPRGGAADAPGNQPQTQHLVLYIEDNPANLKLMAQMLGRRKHINLLTAHNPGLGIELALAHRPELILLDINMPGMNGYQVLDVFKADARLQRTPVVAITAKAMPQDILRGMAAGFSDYLTKPLAMTKLFTLLDRFLFTKEDNP